MHCPVCHADLELMLMATDDAPDAEAERAAWERAEQHALLREAERGAERP
jgi:hypothetical protein